jgi:uncharacterized protein YceK
MKTVLLVLFAAVALLSGCAGVTRTRAGFDRHGAPSVTQTGSAKEPGKASVETTIVTVPLPAGSKISPVPAPTAPAVNAHAPDMAAGFTIQTSAPTELRIETRREVVEGAKTPEPPPPPSPAELARGVGVRWFYFAGIACGLAAVASIYFGHAWAAKSLVVAAAAFPAIGNLVSSTLALTIGCMFVALAGGLYLAWKILAKRHGLDGNQAGTIAK